MDVAPLNTVVVHARDTDAMDIDRDDIPEPQTAATMATFKTAFEVQPTSAASSGSPTTPKATQKQPEYIHVQWEHNTDITKDLMGLCDTIDDRARKGKKVLVHCQQGASRSASLIIAYGMYRNPSLTVDAAYNAAQAKSKWISPNINLMYALQDFRKALQARAATKHGRSPAKHKMALSVDDIDFAQKEPPQTAPLPSENTPSRMSPVGTPPHMRGNSTPNLREITVGPASAPMTFAYTPDKVQLPDFSNWPALSPPQQYSFENSEHQLTPPVPTPPASIERNQPVRAEPVVPMLISHPVPVDTPHQSLPTTSPSATGFFAHREGQGTKRKPKPIPTLDLRQGESSQTLPGLSGLNQTSDIRPQFATRPVAVPETPGLWSPRVAEMAAPLVSKTLLHDAAPTAPAKDESLPPPESVFSPTVTDFGINPFGQMLDVQPPPALTAVPIGQVLRKQKSAIFEKGKLDLQKPLPPLPTVDPRSPAMNGEAGIIRSIDEML
jgi:tyrosine-protein phosphatase